MQHLLVRHQVRVALGQQQQQRLPLAEHARQFVEQGDQLVPQQRHQHQHEHRQRAHEQGEHQHHRQPGGYPQALQGIDQPLHQKRQHHARQHRRKHATEGEYRSKSQEQQDRQHHRFLIGEVALHPVAKHFEH
ncbi:hypothetical protein D3C76_1091960 [compost metagenome]